MEQPPPPSAASRQVARQQAPPRMLWTGGNQFVLMVLLFALVLALFFGFLLQFALTCEWGQGNSCEDVDIIAFVSLLFGGGCLIVAALAGIFLRSNRSGKWA